MKEWGVAFLNAVRTRRVITRGRVGKNRLDPPGQFATGEHDLAATGETFDFQVGPKAENPPIVSPTRVRFPQAEMVIQL
jgi:hypothetical protein